ncbi:MAG TPA: excisionase [Burkholderiaceae bacterium]|nr:excisionase [Burkholderiaceae bacterium]
MKIPLPDWAARHYGPAPSAWVLRKWVRQREIHPAPEKVGSAYYVEETAERRIPQRDGLVERLKQHLEAA